MSCLLRGGTPDTARPLHTINEETNNILIDNTGNKLFWKKE